ncbi:hypothetical protein U9M48_011436 [Paspalum notatum var. saurae]|uniref:F-box domain-containing protein n=1 Tax=Paspalum notatum var. saurae TaxID=547442 RepID=A0AAQ3SXD2_PASNO
MAAAAAAAALMDELIEEVLIRLPPDDPASLVRAGLVCKLWRRLVTDPSFGCRFREFHRRTPPMLGFLYSHRGGGHGADTARFVAVAPFRSPVADRQSCRVVDARHGRVLLHRQRRGLVVRRPRPRGLEPSHRRAGAAPGVGAGAHAAGDGTCDHLSCHRGGPFLVIFVGSRQPPPALVTSTYMCTYSSDVGTWSAPTAIDQQRLNVMPSVLYFLSGAVAKYYHHLGPGSVVWWPLLKYDLGLNQMSIIDLPPLPWDTTVFQEGTVRQEVASPIPCN